MRVQFLWSQLSLSDNSRSQRFLALPLCCCLFLFSATSNVYGQLIDPEVQAQLDTITEYYDAVEERLPNPSRERNTEPVFIPDALPQQTSPISTGANYQSAAYTLAGRDPFAATPIMLENENFTLRAPIDFTPLEGNIRIPNMYLKGIITGAEEGDMAALLQIEGLGVFVVREGDSVSLYGVGNSRDVIQIESISRLSLVVRTGVFGGTNNKRFVVR